MSDPRDVIGARPILLAGAGVSGEGVLKLLQPLGIEIILVDDNDQRRQTLAEDFGVEHVNTAQALRLIDENLPGLVVTAPGWRPDAPLLVHAHTSGIEVIGDVELVWRLDKAECFGPSRTWLAVTGTNGKTTTTAMLAGILQANEAHTGLSAAAVGNIGVSVADAVSAEERVDILVAELSSFQLHWSTQLHPSAGVLLNLAEDHLDWHGSLDEYAASKAKVLQGDFAVLGIDNELVRHLADNDAVSASHRVEFTAGEPGPGQVGVLDGTIVDRLGETTRVIRSAEGIEPAGPAGLYDALAATAVALTQGVAPDVIAQALDDFRVSEHRGAVVHRGTKEWVDNSKATNPHAADAALSGLKPGTRAVWVAGGQLKGAAVEELVDKHVDKIAAAGLLGVDAEVIAQALRARRPELPIYVSLNHDPDMAMDEIAAFAARQTADLVILAPAAASLDMFNGMSHRGRVFARAATRHDPASI